MHTLILDARRGFEPRLSDSESDVLPLDERAIKGLQFAMSHRQGLNPERPAALVS
jgi:hypothetical protein